MNFSYKDKWLSTVLIVFFLVLVITISSKCVSGVPQGSPGISIIVNVEDYGAKGDGVTDDTYAIQTAINAIPVSGGTVVFPKPVVYYLITSGILVRSNIIIDGQMSTIFIPPHNYTSHKSIFYTDKNVITENLIIKNFVLKSINEVEGTGYWAGALVSNNHGIYLQNTKNVIIENITMYNFDNGIKFGTALNKNIQVKNVEIYASMTPVLMNNTENGYFSNLLLDNTGATNNHLHCIYISGNCKNLYWDNVKVMNTPGGGIHFWNGYDDMKAADTCEFDNFTFINCDTAIIVGDARNIKISNFQAENCKYILRQIISDNVTVEKGTVKVKQYLCYIVGPGVTNFLIKDVLVDCSTATKDDLLNVIQGENIRFDNVNIINARANHGFVYNSDNAVTNMQITNCKFITSERPNNQQISFRNAAARVIIENCKFVNNGTRYSSLCNNFGIPNPHVLFRNNTLQGWDNYVTSTDTGTVVENCRKL